MRLARLLSLFTALLLITACASGPRPQVSKPELPGIPDYPEIERNGSLYQPQRSSLALFQDRRPRQVGDILTVVLDEEVSASKNSAANGSRSSSASLPLEQLPAALEVLGEYSFELAGESEFSGSGGAEANNSFTGTISVMVQRVLPNGNLVIEGEKQIAINQGTEYIRFFGVVNPRSVSTENTVPSTEVASARIEYLGDGYINEMQRAGWLQRLFLWLAPF